MKYYQTVTLKDGRACVLRNGTSADGEEALRCFVLTHAETDSLLSYPDEINLTLEKEAQYLEARAQSENEIEILAEVEGRIVGMAGIDRIGSQAKVRHRANFGISIEKAYWGLGIGRALTRACVESARKAGYRQVELEVVAANRRAVSLYESEGFAAFGRNPLGFCSRLNGMQEIILMRLELNTDKEAEK